MFLEFFSKNNGKYLGECISNLDNYIENNGSSHKMNEDVIFYHGHELEYHLNMLGVNIMNGILERL